MVERAYFKPAGEVMTFCETARHILEASRAIGGLLLDAEENLAPAAARRRMAKQQCA